MSDDQIRHISDTASLAAGWRAMESDRPDALFHDPLAARLAGERGVRIARTLPDGWWVVAIRTVVIDAYVRTAIASGVDTIVNIGAGLDTRPYRMDLPSSLRWVEVDLPDVIDSKEAQLRDEVPVCSVERVNLPTERNARRDLLNRVVSTSIRAMALTEGVIPYLSVVEAGELADDLHAQPIYGSWVVDYLSSRLLAYYQKHQQWREVPVRFDPPDWETFVTAHGWRIRDIRYLGEESRRLHRAVPLPFLDKVMSAVSSRPLRERGFALLERVA